MAVFNAVMNHFMEVCIYMCVCVCVCIHISVSLTKFFTLRLREYIPVSVSWELQYWSFPCAYLIKHYATKTYGGSVGLAQPFLISVLDRGDGQLHVPATLLTGAPDAY
jgi:hypothetical protein